MAVFIPLHLPEENVREQRKEQSKLSKQGFDLGLVRPKDLEGKGFAEAMAHPVKVRQTSKKNIHVLIFPFRFPVLNCESLREIFPTTKAKTKRKLVTTTFHKRPTRAPTIRGTTYKTEKSKKGERKESEKSFLTLPFNMASSRYANIIYFQRFFIIFFFSITVENESVLAENWVSGFFQRRPTDRRFDSVKMHVFHPVESLTHASNATFILPRFLGPNAYIPSGMLLKADIVLSLADGAEIPASKTIAPVNNTFHTLFRSCRIWLGETLITKNGDNYPYKSYLIDLLSNDGSAKFSWLESQMWYIDVFGPSLSSQTSNSNPGFKSRMNIFKTADQSAYHQGEVSVMGRLHTDLGSTETGLIPGLGLRVELGFSTSAFLLQKPTTDTSDYKISIKNMQLFCPVAQLSADIFRKLEAKLARENASLYIRRVEVTNKSIASNLSMFVDQLFPGAPLPAKLLLFFTPTTNYMGSQTTNPFYFPRQFSATGEAGQAAAPPGATGVSGMIDNLLQRQGIVGGVGDCYIQNVKVTLNGESLDGLGAEATERSDITDYVRLHYYMGFMTSRTGNSLTYSEFMNGFYFLYYDLSTSAEAFMEYNVPSVRQGNLNVQINFSKPTPVELTLLLFAEYPTKIEISQARQVSMSY